MRESAASVYLVGGLILAVYFACFVALPRGVFYSPDAGGKYLQMLGYRWAGGLRCEIIYPGAKADPDYFFYGNFAAAETKNTTFPWKNEAGETRTGWTPWFSLLVRPAYRLWGFAGLHAVPWLAGLLTIALAGYLATRLRPGTGLLAAVAVGLATPVLFYSLCFWEHTLAVFLALAALLPWVRAGSTAATVRPSQWCISGALLLAACALRRELIFFLGALLLAWGCLHPHRRRYLPAVFAVLLALGASGAILLLVHPAALYWLFPSGVSDIGWLRTLLSAASWKKAFPNLIRELLLYDVDGVLPGQVLWAGILGLTICLGNPFAPVRWRRGMVLTGAALVSLPALWLVCAGVRYRALNSQLLPAPLALLALLPSVGPACRIRRWLKWTVWIFLGMIGLVLPAADLVHGGLEWGSRYALVAIVLLNVLGVVAVVEIRAEPAVSRSLRGTATLLAIWLVFLGAVSAARGVHELWRTRRDLLELHTTLESAGDPVVTDLWWFGASMAPYAARHEVYTVSSRHPLWEWLTLVGSRRLRFTYLGESPPDDLRDDRGIPWLRQESPRVAGQRIVFFRREPSTTSMSAGKRQEEVGNPTASQQRAEQ